MSDALLTDAECLWAGTYKAKDCAAPSCPKHGDAFVLSVGGDPAARYTTHIPGAFDTYWQGTSVEQDLADEYVEGETRHVYTDDVEGERAAYELRDAMRAAPTQKRGKGTRRTVEISRAAANVLWGYASMSIFTITEGMGGDERRWYTSELRAARKIVEQIEAVVPGADRWVS